MFHGNILRNLESINIGVFYKVSQIETHLHDEETLFSIFKILSWVSSREITFEKKQHLTN